MQKRKEKKNLEFYFLSSTSQIITRILFFKWIRKAVKFFKASCGHLDLFCPWVCWLLGIRPRGGRRRGGGGGVRVTESLYISDSRGFWEGVGGTGGSHFFSTFHTDVNTHTHACTHTCTHTCTHIHTQERTYIHTYTQTSHPLFLATVQNPG